MSAGFTPGPWLIEENLDEQSPPSIMVSTQDAIVAEVYADQTADEPECVATASLIAAAPELYETAQAFLQAWNDGQTRESAAHLAAALGHALAKVQS